MKVLIGPLNIASQPAYLARGLRKHGIDATSLMYGKGVFGYQADWQVDLPRDPIERVDTFANVVEQVLDGEYDILHLFQRPLYMSIPPKNHDKLLGLEIPLIKARGTRIAYRFTGWELIDREREEANNPYSAFRHGWDGAFDPLMKREYLDFLREYVDAFMVVDPMMREHCPEADIVPRVLRVEEFEEVGIERTDRPLVLHAPSNAIYKGSKFVLQALRELEDEGLQFEFKLLERVPHAEALEWYKRADIIVDQMLIGWYGVLATECMAMGKPVAVYMRPDLANTPDEIPVFNINIDNIKDRLRLLIRDFDLRHDLAIRGRPYVQSVHDESVVIPKLIRVYERMLANPPQTPSSKADLRYLHLQRRHLESIYVERTKLIRQVRQAKAKLAEARKEALDATSGIGFLRVHLKRQVAKLRVAKRRLQQLQQRVGVLRVPRTSSQRLHGSTKPLRVPIRQRVARRLRRLIRP